MSASRQRRRRPCMATTPSPQVRVFSCALCHHRHTRTHTSQVGPVAHVRVVVALRRRIGHDDLRLLLFLLPGMVLQLRYVCLNPRAPTFLRPCAALCLCCCKHERGRSACLAVLPSEFGVPKPWYFLCQPRTYCKRRSRERAVYCRIDAAAVLLIVCAAVDSASILPK